MKKSQREGMYREHILDHYKNPRNHGLMKQPDIQRTEQNTVCGDELTVMIKLDAKKVIKDVRFSGRGCAISVAAMSMLTELIKGKTVHEVLEMDKDVLLTRLNIPIGPVRLMWMDTPRPDRKKLRKEMRRVVDQAKKDKAEKEARA